MCLAMGPTQFSMINFRFQLMHYSFISLIILLYMFRAPMCPSSGGSTIHVYCCNPQCNCIMCVGHVTLDYISNRTAV